MNTVNNSRMAGMKTVQVLIILNLSHFSDYKCGVLCTMHCKNYLWISLRDNRNMNCKL